VIFALGAFPGPWFSACGRQAVTVCFGARPGLRFGEPQFPFSVEFGFQRSHRMQRKRYKGLSNPQCIHGVRPVRHPDLRTTEHEIARLQELTGRMSPQPVCASPLGVVTRCCSGQRDTFTGAMGRGARGTGSGAALLRVAGVPRVTGVPMWRMCVWQGKRAATCRWAWRQRSTRVACLADAAGAGHDGARGRVLGPAHRLL